MIRDSARSGAPCWKRKAPRKVGRASRSIYRWIPLTHQEHTDPDPTSSLWHLFPTAGDATSSDQQQDAASAAACLWLGPERSPLDDTPRKARRRSDLRRTPAPRERCPSSLGERLRPAAALLSTTRCCLAIRCWEGVCIWWCGVARDCLVLRCGSPALSVLSCQTVGELTDPLQTSRADNSEYQSTRWDEAQKQ